MGNEHLTLSLIADEVGCSPPALVQRFGSKRALLMKYVAWSTERIRERFDALDDSEVSPLQRIKEMVGLPRSARPYEITDPEGLPTSVFMHLAAWNDEAFKPLVEERTALIESELKNLLEQATIAGEIRGCDEQRMARTLMTAFSGAALQAIAVSREPIEDRMTQLVDHLLEPYLAA